MNTMRLRQYGDVIMKGNRRETQGEHNARLKARAIADAHFESAWRALSVASTREERIERFAVVEYWLAHIAATFPYKK